MDLVIERRNSLVEPLEAITHMMKTAGIGPSELSRRLGKSRGYISTLLSTGVVPKTDTLTHIAHECGYHNVLESSSDRFELYTDVDDQRRLRRMLESTQRDDETGHEPTDVPVTPSVEDVVKAYREGRLRIDGGDD